MYAIRCYVNKAEGVLPAACHTAAHQNNGASWSTSWIAFSRRACICPFLVIISFLLSSFDFSFMFSCSFILGSWFGFSLQYLSFPPSSHLNHLLCPLFSSCVWTGLSIRDDCTAGKSLVSVFSQYTEMLN